MFNFKRVLIVIMTLFLTVSCSSREKQQNEKKASLYFGQGTQYLVAKKYTDALSSLLKANKLKPNDPEILNNLGMAYFFKDQKEKATFYLNKAIELKKNNSDAKSNLATLYYQDKKYLQARDLYLEVTKDLTYPKLTVTYFNLGYLEYHIFKRSKQAKSYFLKSIKEDENYCPSHFQLGLISYKGKQFNEALNYFKSSSLGTCYQSPNPTYYQALTLIKLKRYDEARLKLDVIQTNFPKTTFAVKAKQKIIEINEITKNRPKAIGPTSSLLLPSSDF